MTISIRARTAPKSIGATSIERRGLGRQRRGALRHPRARWPSFGKDGLEARAPAPRRVPDRGHGRGMRRRRAPPHDEAERGQEGRRQVGVHRRLGHGGRAPKPPRTGKSPRSWVSSLPPWAAAPDGSAPSSRATPSSKPSPLRPISPSTLLGSRSARWTRHAT